MRIQVALELFQWKKPRKIVRGETALSIHKLEDCTIPPGVLKKFLAVDSKDMQVVADFVGEFGVLTERQRHETKLRLKEFEKAQLAVEAAGDTQFNIGLVGLPGNSGFFRPRSLFDYLCLLANPLSTEREKGSRHCHNPECRNEIPEDSRPDQIWCKETKEHCRKRAEKLRNDMSIARFGLPWKEAKEKGERLSANLRDHMAVPEDFDIIDS